MRTCPTRRRSSIAASVVLFVATGWADADELRSPGNLDGWYLTLGPVAAAAHVEGDWISAVGGEISIVHLAEHKIPAVIGISGGGVSYGSLPGGRLYLEAEVGLEQPLPFAVGLALGATAQVDRTDPPRLGAQATLWAIGGVVPYVRVGAVEVNGAYVEAGVMLKVPVRFAY
jgi:hypothetical protein